MTEMKGSKEIGKGAREVSGVRIRVNVDICAKILECKGESKEGKYLDILGSETIPQCLIQECIMAFMFGKSTVPDCKKLLTFPSNSPRWMAEKKEERMVPLLKLTGMII